MNKKIDIWLHDHDALTSYNEENIAIKNVIPTMEKMIHKAGFKLVKVYVSSLLTNKELVETRCKSLNEIIKSCLSRNDAWIVIVPDYTKNKKIRIKCPKCGLVDYFHYSENPPINNFKCGAQMLGVRGGEYSCNFEIRQDLAIELYSIPF